MTTTTDTCKDPITGEERVAQSAAEFPCRYCGCWVHIARSQKTGKTYAADYKTWHGSEFNTHQTFHPAHHCSATPEERAAIDAERAAKRAEVDQAKSDDEQRKQAAREAGVVVPTGKIENVEVRVLTTYEKRHDTYGRPWKMIVIHADGWRVWMTIPSSLLTDDGPTVTEGDDLLLTATITASDDPIFGFAKRPSVKTPVQA